MNINNKENVMKRFITILTMLLLFVIGCTEQTGIISPEQSPTQQLKLVRLPVPQGLSLETVYTESKDINGDNGGYFSEQFSYQGTNNSTVSIYSRLIFPSGSFSGYKTITQTFNTETASLEFGPAMAFNLPVRYTLTVVGLDLSGINTATLDFVYVAQDGSITGVIYDSITVDTATNTIKVTNAQLNHFSRYGFVN
jgi:hypothetical protein